MNRNNLIVAGAAIAVMPAIVWLANIARAAALADRAALGWNVMTAERVGFVAGIGLGVLVLLAAILLSMKVFAATPEFPNDDGETM